MGYTRLNAPIERTFGVDWGPNTVLTVTTGHAHYTLNSLGKIYWEPYNLRYAYIDLAVGGIHDTSGNENHLSLMNSEIRYSLDWAMTYHNSGVYIPSMYCPANGWIYPGRYYSKYDVSSWIVQDTQIDLEFITDGAEHNNLELWGIYPILRMYLE
jgi:hypothetical protein